jgi:hypothetical protein
VEGGKGARLFELGENPHLADYGFFEELIEAIEWKWGV